MQKVEVLNEVTLLMEGYGQLCMSQFVISSEMRYYAGYFFSGVFLLNIVLCFGILLLEIA
jgi:hypothetical protein